MKNDSARDMPGETWAVVLLALPGRFDDALVRAGGWLIFEYRVDDALLSAVPFSVKRRVPMLSGAWLWADE